MAYTVPTFTKARTQSPQNRSHPDTPVAYTVQPTPMFTQSNQENKTKSSSLCGDAPVAVWGLSTLRRAPRVYNTTSAISKKNDRETEENHIVGARVIWVNGIYMDIDIVTGSVEHMGQIPFYKDKAERSVVSAHPYGEHGVLLITVAENTPEQVEATVWDLSRALPAELFRWEACPSTVVAACASEEIPSTEHVAEIGSCAPTRALVALTHDRRDVVWYAPAGYKTIKLATELKITLSLPLKCVVQSLYCHPRISSLVALSVSDGTLAMLRGMESTGTSLQEGSVFMKRWHSNAFAAASWGNGGSLGSDNTFFTGGREGVLCTWSTVTFKVSTLPHFSGTIVHILPNCANPSELAILLNTHRVIITDTGSNKMLMELNGVWIRRFGTRVTQLRTLRFLSKPCVACFGETNDEVRLFDETSGKVVWSIAPTNQKSASCRDPAEDTQCTQVVAICSLQYCGTDHLVILEKNNIQLLAGQVMRILRFFHYDAHVRNLTCNTVVHEPHSQARVRDTSTDGSQDTRNEIIMCPHPIDGVLLTASSQESKLWKMEVRVDAYDAADVNDGASIQWECIGVRFLGTITAAFTKDGSVLGCCHYPGTSYVLYDTQSLRRGEQWAVLKEINMPETSSASSWLRDAFFSRDSQLLVAHDMHQFYACNILSHAKEFSATGSFESRIRKCFAVGIEGVFALWTDKDISLVRLVSEKTSDESPLVVRSDIVCQENLSFSEHILDAASIRVQSPSIASFLFLRKPTSIRVAHENPILDIVLWEKPIGGEIEIKNGQVNAFRRAQTTDFPAIDDLDNKSKGSKNVIFRVHHTDLQKSDPEYSSNREKPVQSSLSELFNAPPYEMPPISTILYNYLMK